MRRSQVAKNPPANAGDARVPCLGWEDPLVNGMAIHSCLESSMDKGAWWTKIHEVTKSQSLSLSHTHTHTDTHTPEESKSHGQRSLADYSP